MKLIEMEDSIRTACFEEITHLICDADKKVCITDISNNWNLSHRDSETILLEWIKKNKSHALSKEFLIRGVEKNGSCVITVIAERKLDAAQKKFETFCCSLYSIELASQSTAKRLNVVKLRECNVINLRLEHVQRDVIVKPLPVQDETTTSKKTAQSMFSVKKSAVKSEVTSEVQAEPISTEKVEIKSEKEHPKKQSPKKKEVTKTPKAANGKASIASFFSKPSTQLPSKTINLKKEPTIEQPDVKKSSSLDNSTDMFDQSSSMDVDTNEETVIETKTKNSTSRKETGAKNKRKRSIVDVDDDAEDEIPCTPQDTKKSKRSNKKSTKHTRIVKMEDSSDDENDHNEQVKLLSSPVKEKENTSPPKNDLAKVSDGKIKRKAKKTVSRTFKDEQGYLVTMNEVVEYSCSEEEIESVPVSEPIKEVTSKQVKEVSTRESSPEKAPKKKKISPPKAGAKQGSILSFFSKK